MAAIDSLVAQGVFDSRSDAVRAGLRAIVDRYRRAQVAAEIVEAYQTRPQTDDEYSWGDEATRDMIADEPW
ncbi:MAG TPA: ribbon-helix-helix domain-containing protein [Euzebyales bacterium]|nr:ribbon-helix-helix domain-containing protein [Euzebyales bacterium]